MAASDRKTLVIKANIGKVVKLIVETSTITFPNIDPDQMRQIPALQGDIRVTVKARTGSTSPVTLNVIADALVPLENAIPMGQGKRKLYVFTDPQCHFCFQLHEELKQIKNLQTFFFLYPLTPASYEKAKAVWCSQGKLKALEETYEGKELKSPPCDTSPIDKNMQLGKRLLVESTLRSSFKTGKLRKVIRLQTP